MTRDNHALAGFDSVQQLRKVRFGLECPHGDGFHLVKLVELVEFVKGGRSLLEVEGERFDRRWKWFSPAGSGQSLGSFEVDAASSALYLKLIPEPATFALLALCLRAAGLIHHRRA